MKNKLLILLFFTSNFLIAQQEIEFFGIKYRTTTKNNYHIYNATNNKFDAFVNYGHDLGKKTKLFYHLSYHSFSLNTVLISENTLLDAVYFDPSIPDYDLVNIASGITNNFKNQWSLTNITSFTFSDDFNSSNLNSHHYFRSFSYLKKKKLANISYGFGVYLSKLNKDWQVLPIISLNIKNEKRGLELFLPRELKLWQKTTSKSYIQIQTIINSDYLKYTNEQLDVQLLSINSELTYNYILNKKLKLKIGMGLPYMQYEYVRKTTTYQTDQLNYSFVIGVFFVVYKKK